MVEKIIQFGEGGFLRGFVDYFIHHMNKKGLFDGKVVVVQPIETGLINVLNEQKGEYNLFLRGIENEKVVTEHTKIESISRGINPYTDFMEYMKLAENKELRYIISNTTEAGIEYLGTEKMTDTPPKSFPAKLTLLLHKRFCLGLKGFVLLPCELIDNNADYLKKYILQYADLWDLGCDFKNWIENENHFCNTLVDRIVTGYPKDEADQLNKQIGYEDKLLDTAEIFHLWVIEGDFEQELPLNKAGFNVVWTDDVSPYKKRKVRILNGAHTSMVLAAHLYGLKTVRECMNDINISAFLKHCIFEEIVPVLGETQADIDFANAVLERFSNPFIAHQLLSIALNSVSKFKVRVLPTILEYQVQYGHYPKGLLFSLAALIAFYKTDDAKDDKEIIAFMKNASVEEILSNTDLWGIDLSDMKSEIQQYSDIISEKGMKEAIQWILLK